MLCPDHGNDLRPAWPSLSSIAARRDEARQGKVSQGRAWVSPRAQTEPATAPAITPALELPELPPPFGEGEGDGGGMGPGKGLGEEERGGEAGAEHLRSGAGAGRVSCAQAAAHRCA